MSKILARVIIPTYNYDKFIEKAVESVLNQNFEKDRIELIVIDDGSTDHTREVIKKYKDAIATAEISLAKATEAKNDDYIKMNKESIAEWSKK